MTSMNGSVDVWTDSGPILGGGETKRKRQDTNHTSLSAVHGRNDRCAAEGLTRYIHLCAPIHVSNEA